MGVCETFSEILSDVGMTEVPSVSNAYFWSCIHRLNPRSQVANYASIEQTFSVQL